MNTVAEKPATSAALFDRRGRALHDLRISVTERCNFRCPHCMPSESVRTHNDFIAPDDYLSINNIVRIARIATKLGVSKVRLTGGEPLLRPDLIRLVQELGQIDTITDLALTTNGYLLGQHLFALKAAGLKRLTISLNSLTEETFQQMNGHRHNLQRILDSIAHAMDAGFSPLKINAVIQKGINDDTILALTKYFRETPHIVRFIEYMDVGTQNGWSLDHVVFAKDIFETIHRKYPLTALNPTTPGETAKRYAYKDGKGEIGIIASISQPFCQTCNRLRLTPDGKLYTCLFADHGLDLKKPMRNGASDDEILALIKKAWQQRNDCYSEKRSALLAKNNRNKKIEMYKIGG